MTPNKVSVIVAPRERYSSLIATVQELILSIPPEVPIVVVEGGSPSWVKERIHVLQKERPFTWLSEEKPLIPNRARNLGLAEVDSEYVVFVDNDITFEPNWLTHLVARADSDSADVVAPLICIGPRVRR